MSSVSLQAVNQLVVVVPQAKRVRLPAGAYAWHASNMRVQQPWVTQSISCKTNLKK